MRSEEEDGGFVVYCDSCGTRILWIQGDCLIIRKKHHGEAHTTVIPLQTLLNLVKPSQTRNMVKSRL